MTGLQLVIAPFFADDGGEVEAAAADDDDCSDCVAGRPRWGQCLQSPGPSCLFAIAIAIVCHCHCQTDKRTVRQCCVYLYLNILKGIRGKGWLIINIVFCLRPEVRASL